MQLSLWMPLFVGLVAIAGAYWNGTRLERKKAELSLVNAQLEKLYGPLFSLSQASGETWRRFLARFHREGDFFPPGAEVAPEEAEEWRTWMRHVFMPMNERMVEAIVAHIHLIEGDTVPQSFLDLIAHVEAYRVVKHHWAEKDYRQHVSLLDFPAAFEADVKMSFDTLRERQARLIGRTFSALPLPGWRAARNAA